MRKIKGEEMSADVAAVGGWMGRRIKEIKKVPKGGGGKRNEKERRRKRGIEKERDGKRDEGSKRRKRKAQRRGER